MDYCRNLSPAFLVKSGFTVSIALGILGFILILTGSGSDGVSKSKSITSSTPSQFVSTLKPGIRSIWPDGRVPFFIDPLVKDYIYGDEINEALGILSRKTCIRFTPKISSDENWLNFSIENGTKSPNCPLTKIPGIDISKIGMRQIIVGTVSQDYVCNIQMLIGRSLGLDFEETRPDRNRFVRYESWCQALSDLKNISDEIPIGHHFEHVKDIFFDYSSLMFRGNTPCLEPVLPGIFDLSSATSTFSILDIEKLNALYNCAGCKSYRFLPSEKVLDPLNSFESFSPVVGGREIDGKTPLYICRVYQLGSIVIGKVTTSKDGHKSCWVEDRGSEHNYNQFFEFLTNPAGANLLWKSRSSTSDIPPNAIVGGRTGDGKPIYIGRCKINYFGRETIVTGSIIPNIDVFKVPFNHMASLCPFNRQEILVCEE